MRDGTLPANTTIWYTLQATEHSINDGRSSSVKSISANSPEFSITTNGTHRSVNIAWVPPAKLSPSNFQACMVWRSNTSGDYLRTVGHYLPGPGGTAFATTVSNTSFLDDGTKTLGKGDLLANGVPWIQISSGGIESENTIFQAYQANGYSNFAGVETTPEGTPYNYSFMGIWEWLNGSNTTFTRGTSILLTGTIYASATHNLIFGTNRHLI